MGIEGIRPTLIEFDEANDINVQKEAEELGEILDEFEKIKEMPSSPERFYPINRKAKRAQFKKQGGFKRG